MLKLLLQESVAGEQKGHDANRRRASNDESYNTRRSANGDTCNTGRLYVRYVAENLWHFERHAAEQIQENNLMAVSSFPKVQIHIKCC